jgi:hypothetical protein
MQIIINVNDYPSRIEARAVAFAIDGEDRGSKIFVLGLDGTE